MRATSMSKILVINGAKQFAHSNGELNDTLTTLATTHLTELGHEVQVTRADSNYDAESEVEKILMGRCCYLSNARLVDGRTLDSQKIH